MAANRFVLPVATLLFLGVVAGTFMALRSAHEARPIEKLARAYRALDVERRILADMADVQQGYLSTGNSLLLKHLRSDRSRVERDLGDLQTLSASDPAQKERLRGIRTEVAAAFESLEQAPAPARPSLLAQSGFASHVLRLRQDVLASMADRHRRIAPALQAARYAEAREIQFIIGSSVLACLSLIGAIVFLIQSNARLGRSEASSKRQAAVLQAMRDNIQDGIAVFDEGGKLRVHNRNFFRLLGFPQQLAAEGTALSEFLDIEAARDVKVLAPLPSGAAKTEYRRVRLGELELDVYRTPMPNGGFLVDIRDVTTRVLAERSLMHAQKMEAVGQLTGGIAHDFNNLLQIIGASLDMIARDVRGNARAAERLQNAIGAVDRGARLTSQLLAFARRQPLEPISVDMGTFVRDFSGLLRRTLGEKVAIKTRIADGLWNTLVDPAQVETALLNLAINARDAMPDGGTLTIEVANAELGEDDVAAHAEVAPGQYVMLAVSDTGMGMPPEVVARALDPFFTTKAPGQGTGLGLSQVYGFVTQSGGHVEIRSDEGSGTTVRLYLPRTRLPAARANVVGLPNESERGHETILVVEDNAGVRAAVVDVLGELGYVVLSADNAEQALKTLSNGTHVDLVFTDVVMPGPVSARDLARRARELQPHIVVLFTSGYAQGVIVHDGKLDENVTLLRKPYRNSELAQKLRTMLSRPGPGSSAVRAPASLPNAAHDGPGKKVLVVEDVGIIRMMTVDMVKDLGMRAVGAADAPEAISILEKDPDIDVLLTDLGLPGMDGLELARRARQMKPGIKVVTVSGDAAPEKDQLPGAVTLLKPFDIGKLRAALVA